MRPQVLLTRRIPSSVLARLEAGCDVDLYDGRSAIPREELLERVAGKQALICLLTDRIDREVLDAGRDLRIVANIAVGYNNIDLDACRARGIIATNTPDVLTNACADFTWALILGHHATPGRRPSGSCGAATGRAGRSITCSAWSCAASGSGWSGVGRIGRAVAEKAPAFGMTRRLHGRERRSICRTPSTLPLDRLLATSDVVSLHCPLTPETRHLIDQKALAKMKRSAYLINTSRGPVVDEAALAWALKQRLIAGAALDVYEKEPDVHPGSARRSRT